MPKRRVEKTGEHFQRPDKGNRPFGMMHAPRSVSRTQTSAGGSRSTESCRYVSRNISDDVVFTVILIADTILDFVARTCSPLPQAKL